MTSEDKLIEKIFAGNRTIELAEVDTLLISLNFNVKRTTHTYLYSKAGHRLSLSAHNKVLHPKAVKELRNLLEDLDLAPLTIPRIYRMIMNKNIEYYLELPYTFELNYDPDHAWFVRVKELPGCTSQGETPDEALTMIKDAMQLWIEDALEEGNTVPEPRPDEEFSGRFNLRVPISLHRKLSQLAEDEGVSLNTLCVTALSQYIGLKQYKAVSVH